MKVGDYVVRKKYHQDIVFQITHQSEETYYLKGVEFRLLADATKEDLVVVQAPKMRSERSLTLDLTVLKGKILHLDGDETYLSLCQEKYQDLGLRAVCLHIKEKDMADHIESLLKTHQPDLLIIIGHDGRNEKGEYSHSEDYAACIRKAREYEKDKDRLIIFAGACQSDYERLIAAGANFASSPKRVNIHALDPVYLMSQIAVVNVRDYVDIEKVTEQITCKMDGIGGIDTKGVARQIYPRKRCP